MIMLDYAIVGAGLFGSAAAKYIAQNVRAGETVCLIGPDCPGPNGRRVGSTRLAFGADDDEGRIVQCDADPDLVYGSLARKSIERFKQIAADSGVEFYNDVGFLKVVGSPQLSSDVQQYVDTIQRASGGRASVVQPVHKQFPYLNVPRSCCGILARSNAGHISPRGLVRAQLQLGKRAGCQRIRTAVWSITEEDDYYELVLRTGHMIRAARVLVANGTCSAWPGLLPNNMILDVQPMTQTTVLVEVTEEAARGHLASMPSLSIRDYWQQQAVNSENVPGLAYCLPPIQYPDGRWYMKIGHCKLHDKPLPLERKCIADWYKQRGDTAVGQHLCDIFKSLFPSILPLSLTLDSCVTLDSGSGRPFIDVLPGLEREGTLGVVVAGNGGCAKSSDEIGRLAANLIVSGKWVSDLPRSNFTAKLKAVAPETPLSRL